MRFAALKSGTLLFILAAGALGGCLGFMPLKGQAGTSASSPKKTSVAAADQQVLDTVLLDLLYHPGYPDLRKTILAKSHTIESSVFQIVLADKAPDELPGRLPLLVGEQPMPGAMLRLPVTKDVWQSLLDRNTRPKGHSVRWDGFKPPSKRILVRDITHYAVRTDAQFSFWKQYPQAKSFIRAWLPGYSSDGQTALVEFEAWPATGYGAYILAKQQGRWKVLDQFVGEWQ